MNDMKNLLSVITICKDEPFIEQTCQSVCNQSCQDFEWIVIDGASQPENLLKLKKYASRFNYFTSEPDTGTYNAMNKGIKKAHGQYLLFMNGGDIFYNNKVVETVLPYLQKGTEEVFYGDSYRLFEQPKDCFIKTYPDKLEKSFFLTNTLPHQSSYIKRELFEKYQGYREDFNIVSDKEKWLKFIDNGVRFSHIPLVLSCFRMNGKSRQQSHLLLKEKKEMLESYFPKKELYRTDIPYLQQIFDR